METPHYGAGVHDRSLDNFMFPELKDVESRDDEQTAKSFSFLSL